MSDSNRYHGDRITLVCLHYLGGSVREWSQVDERLRGRYALLAIDLPGFGSASAVSGYSVTEMADYVTRIVAADMPRRWLLVGHSMGAKVAAVIARRFEDGNDDRLAGLEGLVLVAGSPPSPEPMDDSQRTSMLGWFANDSMSSLDQARHYVTSNSEQLDRASTESAIDDVLRARREAWLAWLECGSREDWAASVGIVQLPTTIVAGERDPALGPDAQRSLMMPHFANACIVTVPGHKHLLPMEAPDAVAAAIETHAATNGYRALIASRRVGEKTRAALEARAMPDDPAYVPSVIGSAALTLLRAVVDRIVPQPQAQRIDVAARIDTQLRSGGDGWRFARLPADAEAYRAGLATLAFVTDRECGGTFDRLDAGRQDDILRRVAEGRLGAGASGADARRELDDEQMRLWFEEVCADAVKVYVSHPRTLATIGYSGIANGGDGSPKSGFARTGIDEREAWEPLSFEGRAL